VQLLLQRCHVACTPDGAAAAARQLLASFALGEKPARLAQRLQQLQGSSALGGTGSAQLQHTHGPLRRVDKAAAKQLLASFLDRFMALAALQSRLLDQALANGGYGGGRCCCYQLIVRCVLL
jgi:hypothetical protein